jgi:pimeloyl-ACP methyl ester carboxylesterase
LDFRITDVANALLDYEPARDTMADCATRGTWAFHEMKPPSEGTRRMNESGSYTAVWLPGAKDRYLTLASRIRMRYFEIGQGEPLVLIHTLRTQLDYFQRLAPLLQDSYRLILLDLPGHGHSTIDPRANYDEPFFRRAVLGAVEALGLRRFAIGGESIGGSLALTVAATLPNQVTRVYSLSPYDYGARFGGGIRRSRNGNLIVLFKIFGPSTIELKPILRLVLDGGFATGAFAPEHLFDELVRTGNQRGYRRAEYQLHKHWKSWLDAKATYPNVKAPITLLYGARDWSRPAEREHNRRVLSPAHFVILEDTGHFTALERPDSVAEVFKVH